MSSRASRQHGIPGPASTRCVAGLCTVRRAEPQGSSWAAVAPRASLSARWAGLALALALARGGRIPTCRSSAPNAPGPGHGSSWGSKCLGPFQVWLCTKAREKAGGLHPSAPRLLRGGSDSPRRQARQPPILPQDSCPPPCHTLGRNLHLSACRSPSRSHPALHLASLNTRELNPALSMTQPAAQHS